uniref:Homeobox protein abdominal-B n=1 Tax=Syphacia muris TaxID=451379 RepID=A0A0N5ANS9_9BILA
MIQVMNAMNNAGFGFVTSSFGDTKSFYQKNVSTESDRSSARTPSALTATSSSSNMMSANNLSALPMTHHSHAAAVHAQSYPYGYDWATQQQAAVAQATAAVNAAVSVSTASGFDMMNNLCQPGADIYGSNFHAHAAAAVASGHSWPYSYGQQYSFAPHPYSGAMVADMTTLTGKK